MNGCTTCALHMCKRGESIRLSECLLELVHQDHWRDLADYDPPLLLFVCGDFSRYSEASKSSSTEKTDPNQSVKVICKDYRPTTWHFTDNKHTALSLRHYSF